MKIICFGHNISCNFVGFCVEMYGTTPLIPTNSMSMPVSNSNPTSVFFTHASHATPNADKKNAGSNSSVSMHLLWKLSNTSTKCVTLYVQMMILS